MRLALLQHMFLRIVQVPAFARSNDVSREDVLEMVLSLRIDEALAQLRQHGCMVEDMETSYFLSRDIVIPSIGGRMSEWREKIFAGMHRNAAAAADFLRLPTTRVVELGSKVEI